MIYNFTTINASDPGIFVESVSCTFLNCMGEEALLIFLFIVLIASFYMATLSFVQSFTRASFAIMVIAFFFMLLSWVSGWTFFIAILLYGISLAGAYFMPDG